MANYPKYDWRGIAMLTEQLSDLFQPNQLEVMDAKQKHEMNLLMAKQSWDTETANLDLLMKQYDKVTNELATQEESAVSLGVGKLARVSAMDGAMPDAAVEMFNKTEINKISQIELAQSELNKMISSQKDKLTHYMTLNEHGKLGGNWADTLEAQRTETRKDIAGKNYKTDADIDKSGTLSWDEQNNAIRAYIADYYMVDEGEEGMQITVGDETIQGVKPEAHAFVAGFQHVRGRGAVDKAEQIGKKGSVKDTGRPSYRKMSPDYLLETFDQNNKRIEAIDKKLYDPNKPGTQTLQELLTWDEAFGRFVVERSTAIKKGYTDAEITDYEESYDVRRNVLKEIRTRPELGKIDVNRIGMKHPKSHTINRDENPKTHDLFASRKSSPDQLFTRIMLKEGDSKFDAMILAYSELMDGDKASISSNRAAGLDIILKWLND